MTALYTEPDYGQLLHANLARVFNERDAARRDAAIAELFGDNPVMYKPNRAPLGAAQPAGVTGLRLFAVGQTSAAVSAVTLVLLAAQTQPPPTPRF